MNDEKKRFRVRDLALYGLLIAIMEVCKHALDFLPNVEMISLLVILYALHLGKKTLFLTLGFTLLEIFYWGPHTWVIMYLYVWPILVFLTLLVKKHRAEKYDFIQFAVLSGIFGLFFGAMCSLVYLVIGGPAMAFSWWVAGIPYDLIHAGANFAICLILFRPLDQLLGRVTVEEVG